MSPWKLEAKARGCYIRGCFNETSFPIHPRCSLRKRRQTRVWILLARVKRLSVRFICNQRDRDSTKAKYSDAQCICELISMLLRAYLSPVSSGVYKNLSKLVSHWINILLIIIWLLNLEL